MAFINFRINLALFNKTPIDDDTALLFNESQQFVKNFFGSFLIRPDFDIKNIYFINLGNSKIPTMIYKNNSIFINQKQMDYLFSNTIITAFIHELIHYHTKRVGSIFKLAVLESITQAITETIIEGTYRKRNFAVPSYNTKYGDKFLLYDSRFLYEYISENLDYFITNSFYKKYLLI